jgi:hypothetical protein
MYSGLRNPLKLMSYVTPLMAIATALHGVNLAKLVTLIIHGMLLGVAR